jgi:hypothetical protein
LKKNLLLMSRFFAIFKNEKTTQLNYCRTIR